MPTIKTFSFNTCYRYFKMVRQGKNIQIDNTIGLAMANIT